MDYGIKLNPNFKAPGDVEAGIEGELRIDEMKRCVFDQTMYEFDNRQNRMVKLVSTPEGVDKIMLDPKTHAGMGLDKNQLIKHCEDLRALCYSILT